MKKPLFNFFKGTFVSFLILFASCNPRHIKNELVFTYVDPLEKIFKETAFFPDAEAAAHVARGEHATFQFAFRTPVPMHDLMFEVELEPPGETQLGIPESGFVDFVRFGRKALEPATDRLHSVSGFFPDPIIVHERRTIGSYETLPIWIRIPILKNTEPGTYTGKVTIKGKSGLRRFRETRELKVQVYSPVIDRTSLWVTNWFGYAFSYMNNGKDVEPYSDMYWDLTRTLARQMAQYRQNVALISPLQLAEYVIGDSLDFHIDFTRFIKTVEIFSEEGVLGRIEGGHIGTRESTWTSPFRVFVPVEKSDSIILEKFEISSDTARIFYTTFFTELSKVLQDHHWQDIYMQHIADEPIDPNVDSYIEISNFIRKLIPDIPIIEACHSSQLENSISIWVPQLDFFHIDHEFYNQRREQGDEIWFYTCLSPKGEYANRFIDQPLIKTRLLHWINFKYNASGYLHWGLNHWNHSRDPYNETSGIILESGNIMPAGDAWIIYPGERQVYPSLRLEAMRDGIVDYELLRMLSVKDEEKAMQLANQIVFAFNRYETDIGTFRSVRRQMLELLSYQ